MNTKPKNWIQNRLGLNKIPPQKPVLQQEEPAVPMPPPPSQAGVEIELNTADIIDKS